MPGYSRSFDSFTQAALEAGESRVMGGIHFEFDNIAGLLAGGELGAFISQNFLLPRRGPDSGAGEGSPWSLRDAAAAPTEGGTASAGVPGLPSVSLGVLPGGAAGQSFPAGNLGAEGTGPATPADARNVDLGMSQIGRPPEHALPGTGLVAFHLLSGKRRLSGDFSEPNVL